MRAGGSGSPAIVAGIVVVLVRRRRCDRRRATTSGETVAAGEWAQSVCGAVGVWRGEMEAIVEDDPDAAARRRLGVEEPQSETPQGRSGLRPRRARARRRRRPSTLVEGIDNAGVPDTPQGEQAANAALRLGATSTRERPRGRAGLARRGGGHASRTAIDAAAQTRRGVARRACSPAASRRSPTSRALRSRSSRPRCATRAPASSCARRTSRR